jgi:Icc-related predicted phosphoesterase
MKIVLISDTHNQHDKLVIPAGDMVIHAGDVTSNGSYLEVASFLRWFSELPIKYKIFIAGNHDYLFERHPAFSKSEYLSGIIYLENELVEIEGLKIFGSPYIPQYKDWAFMKKSGDEIREVWNLIPNNLDILVTHGPPYMILDQIEYGFHTGCRDLLTRIKVVRPKVHVFGHVHEGYGAKEEFGIRFFNASVLSHNYRLVNGPISIEV